jgi:hypothetical protein
MPFNSKVYIVSAAACLLATHCTPYVSAFSSTRHTSISSALYANESNDSSNKPNTSRRDIFQWIRRVAFLGAGGTYLRPILVSAEVDEAGRTVELKVANLQGDPDLSGVIQIQLEPSWAPRGVQRFVSFGTRA